jgi:hypothetical protein
MKTDTRSLTSGIDLQDTRKCIEGVDAILCTPFLMPINSSPDQSLIHFEGASWKSFEITASSLSGYFPALAVLAPCLTESRSGLLMSTFN